MRRSRRVKARQAIPHFSALFGKALAEPRLTELLSEIANSDTGIAFSPGDSDHEFLVVLGAARVDGERLVTRNQLYQELISKNPQFSPGAEAQKADQFLVAPAASAFAVVADEKLRQFASENFDAAVKRHNVGHHRLGSSARECPRSGLAGSPCRPQSQRSGNCALAAFPNAKDAPSGSPSG